jgi:hypothetical protein
MMCVEPFGDVEEEEVWPCFVANPRATTAKFKFFAPARIQTLLTANFHIHKAESSEDANVSQLQPTTFVWNSHSP